MSLDTRTDVVLAEAAPERAPRRGRTVVVTVLAVLAFALLVRQSWPNRPDIGYDPDSAAGAGTRAVAQVLRHEGVDVDVVHDRDDLREAGVDGRTTLVVSPTPMLSDAGLRAVRERAHDAGHVVLLGADHTEVSTLGLPVEVARPREGVLEARCTRADLAGVRRVGPVDRVYRPVRGAPSRPGRCFPSGTASALLTAPLTDDAGHRTDVDLFGPADALTNDVVTSHDDAALALRLLGGLPRVVWYSPDASDVRPGDRPSDSAPVAPRWLQPLVVLLLGAVLLTMWWRGRRLGALATEPLPVLVRAAESTVARGRLYRRAHGREHAVRILRDATARRLTDRLGLPRDTDRPTLVAAVAHATGRPEDDVEALIAGPTPTTDTGLAQVAQDLAALDEGIRP